MKDAVKEEEARKEAQAKFKEVLATKAQKAAKGDPAMAAHLQAMKQLDVQEKEKMK